MKNYISMFIMIIVGFIFQTTIFRSLKIAGVSPNILVILTAIAGTMYGQYAGMFSGIICGLFVDLMYSSVIGVNIFIYAIVGFIIGMTNRIYIEDDIILPIMTIGVFIFKFAHWLDKKINPPKQVNLGIESELNDD